MSWRRITAVLLFLFAAQASGADIQESTDRFGPFGDLHIYRSVGQPRHVTLFISGDGGWNLGVIDMAKSLAELDSMVVGIDITHYIRQLNAGREKCLYPAAHFEELSQYLQKKHHFPRYTLPILAGYSSGATMVYAVLAQSPPNTFAGGISMGFCPDLKTARPFCKGSGGLAGSPRRGLGFAYQPVPLLAAKLYVMQGDIDRVCSTHDTSAFMREVGNAKVVELPRVGHGFAVQKDWMPEFRRAFQEIADAQSASAAKPVADELADLPLVVLPGAGNGALAVVVSGDGGWAGIDRELAQALNKDGIGVVGLNSLHYFWQKKTPDIAGKDLTRILQHYGRLWRADSFILIGYSTGADTLPFMVNRLPEDLRSRVRSVSLLGPSLEVDFEFHVADWLFSADGSQRVVPEVRKLKGMNVLCVYGADEGASGCKSLSGNDVKVIEMAGGHHFGGEYARLARIILEHSR